ncbi:MAG: hypothetical protein GC134_01555 [Proteobacteria bacterium]|nr:hypothetical protein [Pseudomonadota bacterium]
MHPFLHLQQLIFELLCEHMPAVDAAMWVLLSVKPSEETGLVWVPHHPALAVPLLQMIVAQPGKGGNWLKLAAANMADFKPPACMRHITCAVKAWHTDVSSPRALRTKYLSEFVKNISDTNGYSTNVYIGDEVPYTLPQQNKRIDVFFYGEDAINPQPNGICVQLAKYAPKSQEEIFHMLSVPAGEAANLPPDMGLPVRGNPWFLVMLARLRANILAENWRLVLEEGIYTPESLGDNQLESYVYALLMAAPWHAQQAVLQAGPHTLCFYAKKLATACDSWYTKNRILVPADVPGTQARLALASDVASVLGTITACLPSEHLMQ